MSSGGLGPCTISALPRLHRDDPSSGTVSHGPCGAAHMCGETVGEEGSRPPRNVGVQANILLSPLQLRGRLTLVSAMAWTLTEIVELQRLQRVREVNAGQRGRRTWHAPAPTTTEDGRATAAVPCWTNRDEWLKAVELVLVSERGIESRRANRRVAASTVLAAAKAHAFFAESSTGRHCVASLSSIAGRAGLSDSQVRNSRRVLRDLGLLVDVSFGRHLRSDEIQAARAHHGGTQRAIASEIALTMPKDVVLLLAGSSVKGRRRRHQRRKASTRSHRRRPRTPLSPKGSVRAQHSVSRSGYSTNAECSSSSGIEQVCVDTAVPAQAIRPLALQRLAGQILARTVGLDDVTDALRSTRRPVPVSWQQATPHRGRLHIGRVCDVLVDVGIDPEVWTASQIVHRLNLQAHRRGWTWPTTIAHPDRYLKWRLSQIDWTDHPAQGRSTASSSGESTPPYVLDEPARRVPASSEVRRRSYAQAAALCGWPRGQGTGNYAQPGLDKTR